MQSLRDKLLKAGLVTPEQAEKAETPSPAPPPKRQTYIVARPQSRPAEVPKLPPLPGSKAHQRLESKKQAELDRKLRELVQGAQVAQEPGEQTFHFVTRKGKLRRLELSSAQAALLEAGTLAVVERPEPAQLEHSLVPAKTAEDMLALSEKSVRFWNRPGAPIGFQPSDDPPGESPEGPKDAGSQDAG
jgi:uncharacterized protein YaiL (DUF2058 family)